MSLRQRLRRLEAKAEEGGVLVHQRDGSVRVFDTMHVYAEMFMARMDLFSDTVRKSDVLEAVRNATPESRAAFEEKYGPVAFTQYIVTAKSRGGQVEAKTLTEDGRAERILYEGDSEEAALVRDGIRSGTAGEIPEDLPRPPLAGRWLYGVDDEDLSE